VQVGRPLAHNNRSSPRSLRTLGSNSTLSARTTWKSAENFGHHCQTIRSTNNSHIEALYARKEARPWRRRRTSRVFLALSAESGVWSARDGSQARPSGL